MSITMGYIPFTEESTSANLTMNLMNVGLTFIIIYKSFYSENISCWCVGAELPYEKWFPKESRGMEFAYRSYKKILMQISSSMRGVENDNKVLLMEVGIIDHSVTDSCAPPHENQIGVHYVHYVER